MQWMERTRIERSPVWGDLLKRMKTAEGKREGELMDRRVRRAAVEVGVAVAGATPSTSGAMGAGSGGQGIASASPGVDSSMTATTIRAPGTHGYRTRTTAPPATGTSASGTISRSTLKALKRDTLPAATPSSSKTNAPSSIFPALHATPPATRPPPDALALTMVHLTSCVWIPDRFRFISNWYKPIKSWEAIYKHGGRVHNVSYADGSRHNVMVCTQEHCPECRRHSTTKAGPGTPSVTSGRPFVHARDLWAEADGGLVFDPEEPRNHNLGIPEALGFAKVGFGEGVVVVAAICKRGCEVCGGRTRER